MPEFKEIDIPSVLEASNTIEVIAFGVLTLIALIVILYSPITKKWFESKKSGKRVKSAEDKIYISHSAEIKEINTRLEFIVTTLTALAEKDHLKVVATELLEQQVSGLSKTLDRWINQSDRQFSETQKMSNNLASMNSSLTIVCDMIIAGGFKK